MSIKEHIRKKIRHERLSLSDAHVARLADNLLTQWMRFSNQFSYESIALYYPFDNEASTLEIIRYLHSKNKKVLLPVIQKKSHTLLFAKYYPKAKLIKNNFGILEPQEKEFFEFIQKNEEVQQQLRAPLFEDKVVDFVFELSTISEKKVTKDALQKAIESDD